MENEPLLLSFFLNILIFLDNYTSNVIYLFESHFLVSGSIILYVHLSLVQTQENSIIINYVGNVSLYIYLDILQFKGYFARDTAVVKTLQYDQEQQRVTY